MRGLTAGEARERLARVGPNRVGDHPETPLWRLALAQFRSLVVLLLLAGALVAWVLGERVEALAILAALVLNAAIGFASEWRARISMARLRALAVPRALVRRGGLVAQIPSAELVPGDLIVLEAGVRVPADARLVRSAALRVSEAALTGESDAVDKDAEAVLDPDTPLAERRTMVYLATTALAGSGLAVVTATGLATELGRIGQLVALAGTRATPLERQVEALGRRLIGLALAVCGAVGLAGILHGQPIGLMLETAISLAVAAIPEGLPAVTTVALAAGLWRLARRGCPRPPAARRGDARLHDGDLRGQDRNDDREPHDGDAARGRRARRGRPERQRRRRAGTSSSAAPTSPSRATPTWRCSSPPPPSSTTRPRWRRRTGSASRAIRPSPRCSWPPRRPDSIRPPSRAPGRGGARSRSIPRAA